jgi:hypothetical protein
MKFATHSTGFRITFENEYTISVVFGRGNYCQNKNATVLDYTNNDIIESDDAEVAFFDPSGEFVIENTNHDDDDFYCPQMVLPYVSPKEVGELIAILNTHSANIVEAQLNAWLKERS